MYISKDEYLFSETIPPWQNESRQKPENVWQKIASMFSTSAMLRMSLLQAGIWVIIGIQDIAVPLSSGSTR